MEQAIIQAIKNAGFQVYMRKPEDSYCIFTDGSNLGYLQSNQWRGVSLSTVHVPNTSTGTGFGIADGLSVSDLTAENLREAFQHSPQWGRGVSSVTKYRSIDHYRRRDSWNGAYQLVD